MDRNGTGDSGAHEAPPMRFRHSWRPYQADILRDFAAHAGDGHFHVVAAPGSGKTVIGLEAIRLLGRPALVLVPTIVVREQWIGRLRRDFLDEPEDAPDPPGISRDPMAPGWLTFATYQSLSVVCRSGGEAELESRLRAVGVDILVADEAHHLRAVWWRCLKDVRRRLGSPTVVALTATPPFDVPQSEWNNYASFCGEVDVEVTAPELVAAGSLCPHQDLVHFSVPLPDEVAPVAEARERIDRLFRDFCLDSGLAGYLSDLPLFREADDAALSAALEFYLAAAIWFAECQGAIPRAVRTGLGLEGVALPAFDLRWFAEMLNGLFFGPGEKLAGDGPIGVWRQRMHEAGAVDRRKVRLDAGDGESVLAHSVSRLRAVVDILEHESSTLGVRLRAVVLCDRIRERDFPSAVNPACEPPVVRPGVVPAFERVRRLRLPAVVPAILTGSLVVVPGHCRDAFVREWIAAGGDSGDLRFSALPHDPSFLRIDPGSSQRHAAVGTMTRLFEAGDVNTLFGTAALLGEGWDAPAVNTLVIASSIGSHVMSNQMRGRAIRSVRGDPYKTANIWHLATICDRGTAGAESGFDLLRRRFEAFAGLSVAETDDDEAAVPVEVGIRRLGLREPPRENRVSRINAAMFARAGDRDAMRRRWKRAVLADSGRPIRPVRELAVPVRRMETVFSARFGGGGWLSHSLYRWLITRRFRRIARAVRDGLVDAGAIGTDCPRNALTVRFDGERCTAGLRDRPAREQAVFSRSMNELFDPFAHRPRYLILTTRETFCMPAAFGAGRTAAEEFSRLWRKCAGDHDLLSVASPAGRRALLMLRRQALLERPEYRPEIRTRWV